MSETPITYCEACGWSDERYVRRCPNCGSTNLRHYTRRGKPKTTYIS